MYCGPKPSKLRSILYRVNLLLAGVSTAMSRLVVLSCFACLSLVAACVDTSQPAKVAACGSHCSDSTGGSAAGSGGTTGTGGSGGRGGTQARGGSTAATGGGTAGTGGGTAATGGATGGTGGATVSTSGKTGGTGGGAGGIGGGTDSGGGTGGGGSSGSSDASSAGDTDTDTPYVGAETGSPSDVGPPDDGTVDVLNVGAETGGPEPGQDAAPDIARDLTPDLTPDISPPPPDTGGDASYCIQRFQANGYSLGTDASISACSSCRENGISYESQCKTWIGCLQSSWPCARGDYCWMDCQHAVNGDSVLETCVWNLASAACGLR